MKIKIQGKSNIPTLFSKQLNWITMVLIFSTKYDYSTSCVIRWLNHWKVKVVRMNGDDNVYQFISLNENEILFRNTLTDEIVNLRDAKACWWRRTGINFKHLNPLPKQDEFNSHGFDLTDLTKGRNNYVEQEAKTILDYIFETVYKNSLVNLGKPIFNLNRLIVLDIAKKHGLEIPSYKIIYNYDQLVESANTWGKMVTKSTANGIYKVIDNHRFYTYTELLEEDFFKENKNNFFYPSLITRLVDKQLEIRTFYIDGQFYSMAIFSQSNEQTKVDFRKYANNRNEPFKLPHDIESKIKNVFDELSLNCGSVDLILDTNGKYVFLEINAVGQFGMTSEPCNYNLHKIVAKFLNYDNGHN